MIPHGELLSEEIAGWIPEVTTEDCRYRNLIGRKSRYIHSHPLQNFPPLKPVNINLAGSGNTIQETASLANGLHKRNAFLIKSKLAGKAGEGRGRSDTYRDTESSQSYEAPRLSIEGKSYRLASRRCSLQGAE